MTFLTPISFSGRTFRTSVCMQQRQVVCWLFSATGW
jgi:hypothetical protein